ncbi:MULTISPECIES: hypothetical protein [Alteribacter]|uniref:hypothetical protein n=1 Tax=Alteribacter TaxID=2823237 RepID=UPI001605C73B|nr:MULTISPECIES: hypothetical protein [Alteribacter]MBM7094438.1 hypothetical protein [Alteribacter salitolerans]
MIPSIIITIAWVVVGFWSLLKLVNLFNGGTKNWLDILLHLAVILIALSFIL